MKTPKTALSLIVSAVLLGPSTLSFAQDSEGERTQPENKVRRRTAPSNLYVDPASFFRLHGYATLGFSAPQRQLGADPSRTPHILVSGISPRTNETERGFRHDAAIFVGAEPFDGVSATVELHFVGNGLDPVLTEAKATWDFLLLEDTQWIAARVVGGRYWWPFGNHNAEWFSAVNHFSLVSVAAAEVVPAHYNEVGLMFEGEVALGPSVGLNAVFSVGNGVPGFELSDSIRRSAFNFNGDFTYTGRLALFAETDNILIEAGFSASGGVLRDGTLSAEQNIGGTTIGEDDARFYGADFLALGGDATVQAYGLTLTGYYYTSSENLDFGQNDQLDRQGFTIEGGYQFDVGLRFLKSIGLVGRVSYANEEALSGEKQRWTQYGPAGYLLLTRTLTLRASYLIQSEAGAAVELDNNVFAVSATAEF